MPLTIQQMRKNLRKATGEDEIDLIDVDLDSYLNRAFWELLEKFPFREKEKTVTFPTIEDIPLYAVPSNTEYTRQISIEDPNTLNHRALIQTTVLDYENEFSGQAYTTGAPTHYVREGNAIRLFPTPNTVYTIVLKYYITLADLTDSNNIPQIPQAWHEIIEYGGKWRRFADIGDYDRMMLNKSTAYELIRGLKPTEAKELKDTKLAGLSVPRFENY